MAALRLPRLNDVQRTIRPRSRQDLCTVIAFELAQEGLCHMKVSLPFQTFDNFSTRLMDNSWTLWLHVDSAGCCMQVLH